MTRHGEVRIPPRRLHLLWVFCVSLLGVLGFSLFLRVALLPAIGRQQSFFQMAFLWLVMVCCIISLPYLALFALWAFVRLVFNLPAVILTPESIVNHSIIYHVVIPWREIDVIDRSLTPTPPSSSRQMREQWKQLRATILVLGYDQRRLYERQQPLTRALLWVFNVLRPININTEYLAWSTDEVWTQLERYARGTPDASHIKFVTNLPKPSGRS